MNEKLPEMEGKEDKWDFSDYAFAITGIIVGFLLVAPEIYLLVGYCISLGGSKKLAAIDDYYKCDRLPRSKQARR